MSAVPLKQTFLSVFADGPWRRGERPVTHLEAGLPRPSLKGRAVACGRSLDPHKNVERIFEADNRVALASQGIARASSQSIAFSRNKTAGLLLCGESWRGGVELAQRQGKPWTTPGV
jgi:hypothetical protein